MDDLTGHAACDQRITDDGARIAELEADNARLRVLVVMLDAALDVVVSADRLDLAAGVAHAALHREEYHGNDFPAEGEPHG